MRGVAGAERCGFDARLTTAVLPWQGASVLTVRAVSESPHKGQATLATLRIRRQDTTAARGNYGGVWDDSGVSGSIVNARISVAGNADLEEYSRSGESTASDIVEQARVSANDTVLEIGCGTGRIGIKLAPRCGHWIGSDVSRNMLRHAEDTLRDHKNVSFVHLNGTDLLGIADQSVDVAYCSGVFMHLDEWDRYRYVVEARRALEAGRTPLHRQFQPAERGRMGAVRGSLSARTGRPAAEHQPLLDARRAADIRGARQLHGHPCADARSVGDGDRDETGGLEA